MTHAYVLPNAADRQVLWDELHRKHAEIVRYRPRRSAVDFWAHSFGPLARDIKISGHPACVARQVYDQMLWILGRQRT